ncbi:hypothetical protein B0H34DRAFT_796140 [Crassisporium funariophilum]|nr:hypothetical protein B0H34DRAFT_796140 [Crassisporium funariophilum]
MLANSLTREAGLKVGPVILEVLVKHYFERLKKDAQRNDFGARLKEDDILFDEAFTIAKSFLNAATFHTVEELQGFSNTRTPSPPWTHVVRTLVPMSTCEEAASFLIKALGGEEIARRLVGGVKWWQVRGVNGVDAQWITAKKDWQEAKRRHKQREQKQDGGYYFGSVDQERYSIQRHARKINGRVFAINYRLAPQYPFPCALQDAVAAYLFLIRPPPGSDHQKVNPAHIIIAGDSAGGGLSLALLQVIRDSGLPLPAGGILISPWVDLTHSFPSIHINTHTDVIPESGLSFHKPSILWPPPSPDISNRVHASLRFRIRQTFRLEEPQRFNPVSTVYSEKDTKFANAIAPNATSNVDDVQTPMPTPNQPLTQTIVVQTEDGETVEVNEQLHFYTQNSLLGHPLVSPATSYLGGLPPLLFIAGDKEVLRDEVIYSAHKAARPDMYPIKDATRALYPALNDIEKRYGPTSVHLQVYDDSPHILPVLFSFTTPAKFCFRAMATFSKFVTEMTPTPPLLTRTGRSSSSTKSPTLSRRQSLFAGFKSSSPRCEQDNTAPPLPTDTVAVTVDSPKSMSFEPATVTRRTSRTSLTRAFSARLSYVGSVIRREPSPAARDPPLEKSTADTSDDGSSTPVNHQDSVASSDVGGPRFSVTSPTPTEHPSERTAGESAVYANITNHSSWECGMIRERVSTKGIVRPLELEAELDAFQMPKEHIGRFTDKTINRYLRDRAIFQKRFSHTVKTIEKHRRQNLEHAKQDTIKRLSVLRQALHIDNKDTPRSVASKNVIASPGWGWAWALDEEEDPPPSSIVSRRDTEEARKLAEIADQAVLGEDHTFSGNNLWSVVLEFLTVTPGKDSHVLRKNRPVDPDPMMKRTNMSAPNVTTRGEKRKRSKFLRMFMWERHDIPKEHP